jgi:hypothetical protein
VPGSTQTSINGLNDAGNFIGLVTNGTVTTAFVRLAGMILPVAGAADATFTGPQGNNNRDQLVGCYVDNAAPFAEHGFLRNADGSAVGPLDFPGAANTQLCGVNDRGTIVGSWYEESRTPGSLGLSPVC